MAGSERFDYVIVGGGGCVLANRRSENPDNRVELVEAGVDTPPNHTDHVLWDSYPIIAYFDRRRQWTDLRIRTRPDGPPPYVRAVQGHGRPLEYRRPDGQPRIAGRLRRVGGIRRRRFDLERGSPLFPAHGARSRRIRR